MVMLYPCIYPSSQTGPGGAVLDRLSPFMIDYAFICSVIFGFMSVCCRKLWSPWGQGSDLLPSVSPMHSPLLTHGSCSINTCWMLSTALGWSPHALAWLLRSSIKQSGPPHQAPSTYSLPCRQPSCHLKSPSVPWLFYSFLTTEPLQCYSLCLEHPSPTTTSPGWLSSFMSKG